MHPTLAQARRFEDLLALDDHDAPYVYGGMFSSKGFRARRLSRKKFKLLKHIDVDLRRMLRDDERVYFLTFGSTVSFWESYLIGWAIYYINRRAIVLTNLRILLLQIDSRERPRDLKSQLDHRTITRVKRTALGNTQVKVKSGKKYLFTRLPRADAKYLQKVVDRVKTELTDSDAAAPEIEELCPHCYEPVPGRPTACPHCGGAFKTARKAALLSLLFPGFGDLYLGHRKFAVVEILVALLIWFGFLVPDPAFPLSIADILTGAALLVLLMHGADALATWYIARKGHHPAHSRRRAVATGG